MKHSLVKPLLPIHRPQKAYYPAFKNIKRLLSWGKKVAMATVFVLDGGELKTQELDKWFTCLKHFLDGFVFTLQSVKVGRLWNNHLPRSVYLVIVCRLRNVRSGEAALSEVTTQGSIIIIKVVRKWQEKREIKESEQFPMSVSTKSRAKSIKKRRVNSVQEE